MWLSSLNRVKKYLCLSDSDPKNERLIRQSLSSVSANVEAYLNSEFELKARTEYFNIHRREIEFWLKAIPITSIASIKHDFDGLFNGGEQTLTDFYIGRDARSVVLDFPEEKGKRVLQVNYTGGVSASSSVSTFAIGTVTGGFIVNNFVYGKESGAYGIIQETTSGPTLKVDVLAGTFKNGEELETSGSEFGGVATGVGATITALTEQSFVELRPEIAQAVEIQIGYMLRVKDTNEVLTIDKDETTRRQSQQELTFRGAYQDLQPEVRSLLNKHRRYIMQ